MNPVPQLSLRAGVSEERAWRSEDTQLCSLKVVFAFPHPLL